VYLAFTVGYRTVECMAVHFSSVRLACAIFLLYRATASRGKCTELGDVHGSCASEVAQEIAETANTEEDGAWLLQIRGAGSDAELSVESTSEPCDKTGPNNMQKVSVPEVTNDVDAVCNDGTPAVYYWAPASCPDYEHKWLVFLGSGGWCWDFDSCAKRSTDSVSSKNYPDIDTPNPHSLFGNHSPFYSYNRVSLRQCSSDAWMGDLGANESIAKVNWRGARIVRSLLQHLVADRGLGNAKLLIFGGASAGGRGAMVHLDTLKKDGLVPRRVPVFGLLDSPYYIEMPPFRNLTMADHSLSLQTQLVAKNMHNEAILRGSGSCRLAEAWKCGFGQFRLSLLKTPFMLIHSQYDAYGISVLENITLFQQPGPDECFPEPQGAHYSFSGALAAYTRASRRCRRWSRERPGSTAPLATSTRWRTTTSSGSRSSRAPAWPRQPNRPSTPSWLGTARRRCRTSWTTHVPSSIAASIARAR